MTHGVPSESRSHLICDDEQYMRRLFAPYLDTLRKLMQLRQCKSRSQILALDVDPRQLQAMLALENPATPDN